MNEGDFIRFSYFCSIKKSLNDRSNETYDFNKNVYRVCRNGKHGMLNVGGTTPPPLHHRRHAPDGSHEQAMLAARHRPRIGNHPAGIEQYAVGGLGHHSRWQAHSGHSNESPRIGNQCYAAGAASQNVYLYCAQAGLKTVLRYGCDREAMKQTMQLSESQTILYVQTVGR